MAETAVLTLTDFLLARVAEDEAGYERMHETLRVAATRVTEGRSTVTTSETVLHRSKLLAECEAKRGIVDLHHEYLNVCAHCVDHSGEYQREPWPCVTMRLMTLPYADHPDYREEWRP